MRLPWLRCGELIDYWERQYPRQKQANSGEWDAVSLSAIGMEMRLVEPYSLISVSNEVAEALESLLQRSELMIWLRLNLWTLFWYINEPNFVNISNFIETLRAIEQIPEVSEKFWFYSGLAKNRPLFSILVKREKYEGDNAINRLLPFLNTNTQVSIAKQVIMAIKTYIEKADETKQKQFYIALQTQIELDKLFPQLVTLANEMGITVEELVDAHITIYGYHISPACQTKYTIEELQNLLITVERTIEQNYKLGRLTWCFAQINLPPETDLLIQLRQLLDKILEYPSNCSNLHITELRVTLFLKLLADDTQAQEIAPRLFTTLSLTDLLKLSKWFIPELFGNLSSECLAVLKSFLTHKQEAVRVGSALLLKAFIGGSVDYRGINSEELKELSSIRFNVEMGWSLVNSDNSKRRLVGIAILSLSDYPIEDVNYQRRLLEVLQQTQNAEEHEAWVELLKEIPISDEKHTDWCNLLEAILSKPWDYSNSVLSVAMQRYQALASPVNGTISEVEEKALGLL
jgi:hypothetical protein